MKIVRSIINKIRPKIFGGMIPEGSLGLRVIGYKNYVGGMWDEIGKLQFEYLVSQGLKPEHCFLDIGCGALRGGNRFIKYLNPGKYLGFDKEKKLVNAGIKKVLPKHIYIEKNPEFQISDDFDFKGFSKKPDYSLALSLFTHLNRRDIEKCLKNLIEFVKTGHIFFATFFEGESENNPGRSHSLDHFDYTKEEMIEFGEKTGWKVTYIGDWNHPRDQKIVRFTSK